MSDSSIPSSDEAIQETAVQGVRLPKQGRSRKSFDRMLEAARDLMAEGGIQAVTVQEVIKRAKVGAGSFYARFDSHEALIQFLHNQLWEEGEEWWEAYLAPDRWKGWTLAELVGEIARVLVRTHFPREPLLKAFWTRAVSRPADGIMERTAEWDWNFVESVAELILERAGDVGHPVPERASRLAAFQLLTTLRGHLFFPDSVALDEYFSLEQLILELTRAMLGYLEVEGAPASYGALLRRSAAAESRSGQR